MESYNIPYSLHKHVTPAIPPSLATLTPTKHTSYCPPLFFEGASGEAQSDTMDEHVVARAVQAITYNATSMYYQPPVRAP